MTNSSSGSSGSSSMVLYLPLVPYGDCSSVQNPAASVLPPLFHLLSVLGVFGNLCSLWACLRPSRPWTIGSIGVLNLALCDLAYLASVPPIAVQIGAGYDWHLGRSMCFLCLSLHFVGLTSSTMFICAISIDRFLAIVFPLESRMVRTPRNAALVSLLLWAITALLIYLSYPNVVYWQRRSGLRYCGTVVHSRYKSQGATYNLLSYYSIQVSVPLLLIIPSYVKIVSRVRQAKRQRPGAGGVPGHDRTMWLIAVFIANFLVCWVPGQLLHIIACIIFFVTYERAERCRTAGLVNLLLETSKLLYCLNACLDPAIFHIQEAGGGLPGRWPRCCRRNFWRAERRDGTSLAVSVVNMKT
uniref:C-C chemokine receptor type 1-like n=1 Tax=Centroberyx gerrardi TaxID=166262 RepID=UPI003AAC9CF5